MKHKKSHVGDAWLITIFFFIVVVFIIIIIIIISRWCRNFWVYPRKNDATQHPLKKC